MVQNQFAAGNYQSPPITNWRPSPSRIGRAFPDAPLYPNRPQPYNPWGPINTPRGYGLDLNQDGRFNPHKDGFVSFDLNRDGQHSDYEVQQSRNLLKAFSGDFDANGDGQVDFGEMFQGYSNFFQSRQMDLDRDGVLSKWELQKAGASVVQRDSISGFGGGESRPFWRSMGLDNLPGGRSLDFINPWNGSFGTSFDWSKVARPAI